MGRVEGFVIEVDEIDVVEVLPLHTASVQVTDAVSGDVGDLDFEVVSLRLERASDYAEGWRD
jgi:hypothetical protein